MDDLQALQAVARDFSPRVKRVGDGEVLLDVSGLGRLIGPPPEITRQLTRALTEVPVPARVAVAPTQTIARLLARAEAVDGQTRRANDHDARTEHQDPIGVCGLCDRCVGACAHGPWLQLPVELLRELEALSPGTSVRDRARPYDTLQKWGIATLGALAALPTADLSSRLGRRGVALQRLARGHDLEPFVPDDETPRYVARLELEWPIDALEPLSFVFARLLEPLAVSLERVDRAAAAVRLDLRLTDRSTHARVLQLPAPMRDARVLRTLLLLDLESSPLFAADVMIDVVTIELDPAPSRITQFSLLRRALPSPETLSTLIARLSALAGESRVGSPALVESHRADAFAMSPYAPDGAGSAEGPKGAPILRRRRPPVALSVALEQGRPVHVASSRRGIPYGAIVQAAGPWRSSGEWWSRHAWDRNEWDVALKSGAVCRVFQDRATSRWFLEGVYD